MDIERTIRERITAGDLTVELECDGRGAPKKVHVFVETDEQEAENIDAEVLLRVAEIVRSRFYAANDYRSVCPTHGLLEFEDGSASSILKCPKCKSQESSRASVVVS